MYKRRGGSHSNTENKSCKKSSGKTRSLCLEAFEAEFGSISDYGQDAWSELPQKVVSKLSQIVVSLASFNGNQMHFGCTGIVVENNESITSILTSATLVRSIDDRSTIIPTLMIEVRLTNKKSVIGCLAHYDLHYNVAVITIKAYPRFRAACFDLPMHFGSYSKVVAVGRWFYSGKLIATSGMLIDESSGVYPEHVLASTCNFPMVMTGGPLIDLDGNFVGMNFYSKARIQRAPFLPRNKIYDCLVHSRTLRIKIEHVGERRILKSTFMNENEKFNENGKLSMLSSSDSEEFMDEELWLPSDFHEPMPVDEFTELVRNDLGSRGYPMPTMFEGGMCLINTFEEEFAEDTWSKLSNKVALNLSRSVVSLASFKGEKRFFVCTGIFIDFNESTSRVLTSASLVRTSADENEIADNLKIQVYLPNKQLAVGTLQHYNLSYNIAVISIVCFRCLRPAEFHNKVQIEPNREVVAIGRGFQSGKIMATSGIVTGKESKLDCKELMISTCKITKAGIGGPLVDFDGNFVGMNFYGMKETHYLPRNVILKLIRRFDSERAAMREAIDNSNRAAAAETIDNNPNRWPVPVPRWSYPSWAPRRSQVPRLD